MLNRLIRFSLSHRALILMLALGILFGSYRVAKELPIDVLPDLTKPTVILLTEAQGYAPEEVETLITIPLENQLMGVSGLSRLRSTTDVSLSLIFLEFEWGTDIYKARQFVQERLSGASEILPEGATPYMTPVASLMGEILLVGVTDKTGKSSPQEVRTAVDWTISRRIRSIPGIAEVLSMGGGVQQIEIQPDPQRMVSLGITYEELHEAATRAVSNTTGGFITNREKEIMVRNLAMTTEPEAIGKTIIRHVNDRPISISDVANVVWDIEPMRGDASVNGYPGVIMSITKSPGFDTIALTEKVDAALKDLQKSLPEGMEITPIYRQENFIKLSIGNLKEAIRDGAIMVSIVLFLFLLNLRVTFITLTAIPLSLGVTIGVFKLFGLEVNSMTLGGLAVAIGMVVDDAIVDVENVLRRLKENVASAKPKPKLEVIATASSEVRSSIMYATILIILVFVPLLGLTGVEGRLFAPIAIATIISMVASFFVSLTVVPVLSSLMLNPKAGKTHKDGWLGRSMKFLLKHTWLKLALAQPLLVIGTALVLLVAALMAYSEMGKNFLPPFREPTAVVAMTTTPGTSLQQTNEIASVADKLLLSIPEVEQVGYRAGRAERGDHVVPVSTVEFDVEFHEKGRPREEILEEIRAKMKALPGTYSILSAPLADRIGHMLSGVSAPVAIKIFGNDLEQLRRIGIQVQKIAQGIPGLEQARIEQQAPIPQLRIEIDREKALAYGVTPGELNEELAALIGGRVVSEAYADQKIYNLVIRLPEKWRDSPERLANLYLDTKTGQQVPLKYVAEIRNSYGPNTVLRENTQRRFVVSINPTSDDLIALIDQLKFQVQQQVTLPDGYFLSYEGEYQAQKDASLRILYMSIGVLVIIAMLLFSYFQTPVFTLQVMCDIPLALIGGIFLTKFTLDNVSIATMVGFIAVSGIAARNSIMMISHYLHLIRHEGEGFTREMIERGTQERLVPVLMTAISAIIALIPLVLASEEPGKAILNPVAITIVGGLVTSTLLGLAVTPAVFWAFGKKAAYKAIQNKAPATQ